MQTWKQASQLFILDESGVRTHGCTTDFRLGIVYPIREEISRFGHLNQGAMWPTRVPDFKLTADVRIDRHPPIRQPLQE